MFKVYTRDRHPPIQVTGVSPHYPQEFEFITVTVSCLHYYYQSNCNDRANRMCSCLVSLHNSHYPGGAHQDFVVTDNQHASRNRT